MVRLSNDELLNPAVHKQQQVMLSVCLLGVRGAGRMGRVVLPSAASVDIARPLSRASARQGVRRLGPLRQILTLVYGG